MEHSLAHSPLSLFPCGGMHVLLSGQFPFACIPKEPAPDRLAWCGADHMARLTSTLYSEFHLLPCPASSIYLDSVYCRLFPWNTWSNKYLPASGYRRAFLPFTYSIGWALLAMAHAVRGYVSLCLYLSVRVCVCTCVSSKGSGLLFVHLIL